MPDFFNWLEGTEIPEKPVLTSVSQAGQLYRPSYGRLGLKALNGNSLEIIRFAAGNRLCVDLDYTDNSGRRSNRIIEPYSLRQAQNGNILLYAVRAEDGQIRAYKINQINDASLTDTVYVPRFQVELSPSGIVAPVSQAMPSSNSLGIPHRKRGISSNRVRSLGRRAKSNFGSGPTYIFRCPMCDKKFKRKSNNPKLNAHKTKDGWPCSGRTGYYEDTIY